MEVKCDEGSKTSSIGSDSGSTEEEERLRRLFHSCDRDGDGFIDRKDLQHMCEQLCLEDCVEDLMQQIGGGERALVSFEEFAQCRLRLMNEIEQEKIRQSVQLKDTRWHITDSDTSLALGSSQGYDSGTRDLSPEPPSLYKILDRHNPQLLQSLTALAISSEGSFQQNFMETLNSLHLVALSSLKRELINVNCQCQRLAVEKETVEKHLHKLEEEKLHHQKELEDRLEQSSNCYEERIVELHCVISELRKKLDRHQINVIHEEDEDEASESAKSNKSNASTGNIDNNPSQSQQSLDELPVELAQGVRRLDATTGKNETSQESILHVDSAITDISSIDVEAYKLAQIEFTSTPLLASPQALPMLPSNPSASADEKSSSMEQMHQHLQQLRAENRELREQIGRQETELNKLKAQTGSVREDRDKLKRKVWELQTFIQSMGKRIPSQVSPSSPIKSQQHDSPSNIDASPIAKLAGLKRLKTGLAGHVTGPEISAVGLPNSKLAEQLTQSYSECGGIQETISSLGPSNNIPGQKILEFEIELERLQSKVNNLKAQNDLLSITLEESKAMSTRMSVLMGKYESNNTAMQISQAYSDQALEISETLNILLESQLSLLLANCRAAGLGQIAEYVDGRNEEELSYSLQKAQSARKSAEHIAKQLLARLDKNALFVQSNTSLSPWEDLSGTSHTASTTSSTTSAGELEFNKLDQQKLKEHLEQLKAERQEVKLTMVMLESVHLDPLENEDSLHSQEAQRLDLENAVLMQELTASKEEKAELKAQNYLLLNEKAALELKLSGKESQEKAYLVQIEHLKSEVNEKQDEEEGKISPGRLSIPELTPAITLEELRSTAHEDPASGDLADALRREKKLKSQLSELVATLEKLSRNSEHRHQQSAEFVNDLKRANSALVCAYEKSKKKYMGKIKKLEDDNKALLHKLSAAPLSLNLSQSMAEGGHRSSSPKGCAPTSPPYSHSYQYFDNPSQPTNSQLPHQPYNQFLHQSRGHFDSSHLLLSSHSSTQQAKHAQLHQYVASQQQQSVLAVRPSPPPPPLPRRNSSMAPTAAHAASLASETSL